MKKGQPMKSKFLRTENSAQGTKSKPNPFVKSTLEILIKEKNSSLDSNIKIVDLGCGKLRHLEIYTPYAKKIILVDTKYQVERLQKFDGTTNAMQGYISSLKSNATIVTIDEFSQQNNNVDIVLNVAVMDAVLSKTRLFLAKSAHRNLRKHGYFIVIVPRNDVSILINCTPKNRYQDGHLISKKGTDFKTFYSNFRDPTTLHKLITTCGFNLYKDFSNYRQICWIFQKH